MDSVNQGAKCMQMRVKCCRSGRRSETPPEFLYENQEHAGWTSENSAPTSDLTTGSGSCSAGGGGGGGAGGRRADVNVQFGVSVFITAEVDVAAALRWARADLNGGNEEEARGAAGTAGGRRARRLRQVYLRLRAL